MNLATPEVFGARILRERKRQGLSAAQLSAKAGIRGHNVLIRLENARNEPGLFKAARIAAALGMSLDALLAPAGCPSCDGMPPAGIICPDCRKRGGTP